jgi:hypothetical protein
MRDLRFLLAPLLLALSACSGDSGKDAVFLPSHKAKPAPVAKKGPTLAEQTAGMVLAASPARSEPIAELKFELRSRPIAGRALTVDLALLPQIDASSALIELSGTDGLKVAEPDASMSFSDILPTNVYRKSVTVTPPAEGVFYLNAVATLKSPDFSQVRNFTIPIIAAADAAAAPVANETQHKGR